MTIYVDPLFPTPGPNPNWPYPEACHLWADTEEDLHAFARKIGLPRGWLQDRHPDFPHYDLTRRLRKLAIDNGAVSTSLKAWLLARRMATPKGVA